jgi:hypothetical protein
LYYTDALLFHKDQSNILGKSRTLRYPSIPFVSELETIRSNFSKQGIGSSQTHEVLVFTCKHPKSYRSRS